MDCLVFLRLIIYDIIYARRADHAKNVYRLGISKCTRAVERLKTRYQEFQARVSSGSALPDNSRKTNLPNAEVRTWTCTMDMRLIEYVTVITSERC